MPPKILDHGFFSTGMLSPVSMDSSMLECQESNTPSIGTFSPGLTMMMSHFFTFSIAMSTISFPLFTFAVFGASPISLAIVCEVDHFALASRYFPKATKVTNNHATSK